MTLPSLDLQKRFDLVSEAEFAALRGLKISALWNKRSPGKGPTFIRVGRRVYYPAAGIKAYLDANTVKPSRAPTLIDGFVRRRKTRRAT